MRWAPREAAWAAVAGRVLSEGSRELAVGRGALWTGGVARAGPSGSCGSAARPGMGPSEASRRGNDGPSSARRGETPPEQRALRTKALSASLCRPRRVPSADPAAGGSDRPSCPARALLGLCCLSCAVVLAVRRARRAPPSCAGLAWRLRRLRGLRPATCSQREARHLPCPWARDLCCSLCLH